jgi:hypothetical protein
MKKFVVIETDTHAGHKHGLCPRVVTTNEDGEYYPSLSPVQVRLLEIRERNLEALKELVKRSKWLYLHGGDQTQGNAHTDSLMDGRMANQTMVAYENMKPVLEMKPNYIRIVKGTNSHEFEEGNVADILHNYYRMSFPKLNIATVWHGLTDFDGFKIDYKHHGVSGGSREWTKTNSAHSYLRSEMHTELGYGRRPPDLYVRAHIHVDLIACEHVKHGDKWYHSYLITVPSMCGVGCYEYRAVRNLSRITNGMTVIEIVDNHIWDIHQWHDTMDLRYMETL